MLNVGATSGIIAILFSAFSLGKLVVSNQAPDPANDPAHPEYFVAHVKPIFDANCGKCHEGINRRGGFNMDTRSGMLRGGHDGAALIPGDPDHSLLVRLIRHEGPADDPMPMPPKQPKLADGDIMMVSAWVKAGAAMPSNLQ